MHLHILVSLSLMSAPASSPHLNLAATACDSVRLAQADFLRGRWLVRSREPARSPARERVGESTVARIAGQCAFQETLRMGDDYEEIRLLAFDERGGRWQLAIVDSEHGNLVVMVGHNVPDGLEFISTHQRADRLLVDRVSLHRTESGWVQRTETAAGYGEPWRLLQEISYQSSR